MGLRGFGGDRWGGTDVLYCLAVWHERVVIAGLAGLAGR